jgi:hypothetical protein
MLKILNTEGGSKYFSEYEKSIILNTDKNGVSFQHNGNTVTIKKKDK